VLTGGRTFLEATGDSFAAIQPDDLGYARRVWADRDFFGIVYGEGPANKVRARIDELKDVYPRQETMAERRTTLTRIGRMLGGSATVWVGGMTEHGIDARKEIALRAVNAIRYALDGGILPGGGVALLNCQPVLAARAAACTDTDERAAYRILHHAMGGPARRVAAQRGAGSQRRAGGHGRAGKQLRL
jgi:chaperonin GroEL